MRKTRMILLPFALAAELFLMCLAGILLAIVPHLAEKLCVWVQNNLPGAAWYRGKTTKLWGR